jgi:hypothetical protein
MNFSIEHVLYFRGDNISHILKKMSPRLVTRRHFFLVTGVKMSHWWQKYCKNCLRSRLMTTFEEECTRVQKCYDREMLRLATSLLRHKCVWVIETIRIDIARIQIFGFTWKSAQIFLILTETLNPANPKQDTSRDFFKAATSWAEFVQDELVMSCFVFGRNNAKTKMSALRDFLDVTGLCRV